MIMLVSDTDGSALRGATQLFSFEIPRGHGCPPYGLYFSRNPIFVSELALKSLAILLSALIPRNIIKHTLAIEVVGQEFAINKFTFDEFGT
jgi:hypothetical protein